MHQTCTNFLIKLKHDKVSQTAHTFRHPLRIPASFQTAQHSRYFFRPVQNAQHFWHFLSISPLLGLPRTVQTCFLKSSSSQSRHAHSSSDLLSPISDLFRHAFTSHQCPFESGKMRIQIIPKPQLNARPSMNNATLQMSFLDLSYPLRPLRSHINSPVFRIEYHAEVHQRCLRYPTKDV
jgi:hypothetical protein